jgi:hypothetical protein
VKKVCRLFGAKGFKSFIFFVQMLPVVELDITDRKNRIS